MSTRAQSRREVSSQRHDRPVEWTPAASVVPTRMRSPAGFIRFTDWLCVVTGVAFLLVCAIGAAEGHLVSAALWFAGGSVLVVWGCGGLRSIRS